MQQRDPESAALVINSLDGVSSGYRVLFCDVWGVVHNGVAPFPEACAALVEARGRGLAVVLLTNAPRPHPSVEAQLQSLGVPRAAYDRIVTSGDVTRDLVRSGPRRILHIGPERDEALFTGLDAELVDESEAAGVVCTGLRDDETEAPEDYLGLLRRLRGRDLPFVCANPDVMVERGHRLVWCAGALARDYAQLGGRVEIAGKPFAPIYAGAMQAAAQVLGGPVEKGQVLAIGDGILTDIKGAADWGLDVLYVSGGIHWRDYGDGAHAPDPERLHAFLTKHGHRPVAVMTGLR